MNERHDRHDRSNRPESSYGEGRHGCGGVSQLSGPQALGHGTFQTGRPLGPADISGGRSATAELAGSISTLSAIDNLREISRRCLEGEPLTEDLSGWLGQSLVKFLSHHCRSIDDALGLKFPQGGVPWWREEAIRIRDAALRQLAEQYHAGLSVSAQAQEIVTQAIRYAASTWRFDRDRDEMPSHYSETPYEYLWRAFKSGAAMPIGERQLRNIFAK